MATRRQTVPITLGSFLLGLFCLSFGINANAQIEMTLETPASGETIATVLFVRGWVTAPTGIDRVELLVNGVNPLGGVGAFVIPFGESRPDVGDLFPTFPGSENAGFNLGFFFTRDTFPVGANSVTVTAFDNDGNQRSISVNYTLARFETGEPNNFIRDTSKISLSGAWTSVSGNAVMLNNATIDGQSYDIVIRFNTTLQGFVNTLITKSNGPSSTQDVLVGSQLSEGFDMGVNSSEGRTDWLSAGDGQIMMAYPAGQDWGAVFITVVSATSTVDYSAFTTLSMEMRGKVGGESVEIGIKSIDQPDDGSETKLPISLTTDWTTYTFPLGLFTGVDLTKLRVVAEVVFAGATAQTVYLRSVKYVGGGMAN